MQLRRCRHVQLQTRAACPHFVSGMARHAGDVGHALTVRKTVASSSERGRGVRVRRSREVGMRRMTSTDRGGAALTQWLDPSTPCVGTTCGDRVEASINRCGGESTLEQKQKLKTSACPQWRESCVISSLQRLLSQHVCSQFEIPRCQLSTCSTSPCQSSMRICPIGPPQWPTMPKPSPRIPHFLVLIWSATA